MYESIGYETYSESKAFKNGKEGQLPASGTIKEVSNLMVEDSPAGYELAKANSKSPDSLDRNSGEGAALYELCISCHGAAGDGMGVLVMREKFLGVPSYKDRVITEGSIFHIVPMVSINGFSC
jgi:mono/diheme cytochrome c family protein